MKLTLLLESASIKALRVDQQAVHVENYGAGGTFLWRIGTTQPSHLGRGILSASGKVQMRSILVTLPSAYSHTSCSPSR